MLDWMPVWHVSMFVAVFTGGHRCRLDRHGTFGSRDSFRLKCASPYLARRSRVGQLAQLCAFALAGFMLKWGERQHQVLLVFTVLFGVAGFCRVLSTLFLYLKTESFSSAQSRGKSLGLERSAWDLEQGGRPARC